LILSVLYIDSMKVLTTLHPEYSWDETKFRRRERSVPSGFWRDISNHKVAIEQLAVKLSILTYYGDCIGDRHTIVLRDCRRDSGVTESV
jgi:hypothetical protein